MLVERAGDVVTRAELQQHVWSGDTFVDFERGLNYCVAQIRTALGDSASSPRFIETLPRRGYRFVAPVRDDAPTRGAEDPSPSPPRPPLSLHEKSTGRSIGGSEAAIPDSQGADIADSRGASIARIIGTWTLVIAGVIASWTLVMRQTDRRGTSAAKADAPASTGTGSAAPAAKAPMRIAVALFDNETKQPDYDQLAQTLTDAIVARLAGDPSRLTVVGNAPILRQVRSFRDVTVIGAKLNTGHVIVGQVQQIAGRLRVTAHLIRAADEGHVWARRFEPSESDMPTLDRTVADAVAGAVASKLLGK
jgi:DNA-binding winged helix-turn-helix (wHTH) protein/TolB-like protein